MTKTILVGIGVKTEQVIEVLWPGLHDTTEKTNTENVYDVMKWWVRTENRAMDKKSVGLCFGVKGSIQINCVGPRSCNENCLNSCSTWKGIVVRAVARSSQKIWRDVLKGERITQPDGETSVYLVEWQQILVSNTLQPATRITQRTWNYPTQRKRLKAYVASRHRNPFVYTHQLQHGA